MFAKKRKATAITATEGVVQSPPDNGGFTRGQRMGPLCCWEEQVERGFLQRQHHSVLR